ncbi:MAG: phosphohexomutase domain-containing protein [Armatimonadota bacterium]
MGEPSRLWEALAQARRDLVRAGVDGQPPPRAALAVLDRWPDDLARLPDGAVTVERTTQAWGNLQLILVDGGHDRGDLNHEAAWRRVRRSAELAFLALFDRPEWGALREDLREEILPYLAGAVLELRWGRLLRCRDAIRRLELLSRRVSGQPQAWRIMRIIEAAYPDIDQAGWRGRAGEEVTERRLRAMVQAIAECLRADGLGTLPVIVGYDSRVHADYLARLAAEVLSTQGQPVHLCARDAPTAALVSHLTGTLGIGGAAGIIVCTASSLPVKETGTVRYTGHEYQGLRYLTPAGTLPTAAWSRGVSRRTAELLLNAEAPSRAQPGGVTVIAPWTDYEDGLLAAAHYPLIDGEGEKRPAREVMQAYWQAPDALVILDAMYGSTRGTLQALCDELRLPCEVHHTIHDPLFGELAAASPEPPQISELASRVREMRAERRPLIGIALDADGDRAGIVDENGNYLSGGTVLTLLADFLLNEAYPGEPGLIIRTREVTRALDRLVEQPEYADRVIAPPDHKTLPAYLQAPGYRQLAGDPAQLHGRGLYVARDAAEAARLSFPDEERQRERWAQGESTPAEYQRLVHLQLDRLLLTGDSRGGLLGLGHAPYPDGIFTALLVLQLCAVRQAPIGALWRELRDRLDAPHVDRLRLHAPHEVKRELVNRFMRQFERRGEELAGCTVRFVGGVRDSFIEWALTDPAGAPAYCTITAVDDLPLVRAVAEAPTPEVTHRLLMTVAHELEALIIHELRRAQHPWTVIDIIAELQLPPAALADLPGTFNCRIAEQAYARLQELARPGLEAPDLLRFVTDRLSEFQPEKAQALSACRLTDPRPAAQSPRPPRIKWEDVNEI